MVSYAKENPVYCVERPGGCTASFPGSYWDQLKATREGWFITMKGIAYCPAHVPDWVPAWRERKRLKRLRMIGR